MINIVVNGQIFEGFTESRVENSLDTISGQFFFSARTQESVIVPFSVGDNVEVTVENKKVITGFIDKITSSYDSFAHDITIEGRDITSDIIDSTINENIEFTSSISFEALIKDVLKRTNQKNIGVINNVSGLSNFGTNDLESGEIGQTIFEFLESLARKKNVLITTDGDGNIVITRSTKQISSDVLINQVENESNNIINASVSYDFTDRFGVYNFFTQGNTSSDTLKFLNPNQESSNNRKESSTDADVRSSRVLNMHAEKSLKSEDLKNRAIWEQNIRRVRSSSYTVTVRGFLGPVTQEIWRPNTLVRVVDDFSDIEAVMLINNVSFSLSRDGGSITTLTLVDKDAYQVQANKPKLEKKTNKVGLSFL